MNNQQLINEVKGLTQKIMLFRELRNRNPRRYGTDDLLFMAEADMIDVIGSHKDIHSVEIAQMCNITKSAVSKTIIKLRNKGLVERIPHPEDNRKMILSLTPKGKVVYDFHKNIDNTVDNYIESALSNCSEEEIYAYKKIARIYETALFEIIGLGSD